MVVVKIVDKMDTRNYKFYWEKDKGWVNAKCEFCGVDNKGLDKIFRIKYQYRADLEPDPKDDQIIVMLCNECFTKTR